MTNEEKTRENRVRRLADRQGYRLVKCPRRDPRAIGYGGYMLCDHETGGATLGGTPHPYSADLDEIEAWLTE